MKKIIIDADGAIFGRLCSFAAKKALEGNEIIVINCNKAVIKGNKADIISKYRILINKGGSSLKGPKYIRIPFRMLKRGIRGMLPDHRRGIGKQAISRVKCYNDCPKEYENEKIIKSSKKNLRKFIGLKELSERLSK